MNASLNRNIKKNNANTQISLLEISTCMFNKKNKHNVNETFNVQHAKLKVKN